MLPECSHASRSCMVCPLMRCCTQHCLRYEGHAQGQDHNPSFSELCMAFKMTVSCGTPHEQSFAGCQSHTRSRTQAVVKGRTQT